MPPSPPHPLPEAATEVALVLLAAGRSERLEGAPPKPLRRLGPDAVYAWSLRAARSRLGLGQVILAVPAAEQQALTAALGADGPWGPVEVVAGGPRRADSVRAALRVLGDGIAWVILHDVARPFAAPTLFAAVLEAARREGAATAALPPTDALRWREPPPGGRLYLDREAVVHVQTPQAFRRALLEAAHGDAAPDAPDDASLVAEMGHPVALVPGAADNFEITGPADWARAEAQAGAAPPRGLPRIGQGYDVHRLAAGRPLRLAGVALEAPRGLAAHSDGDVACHACADALLGAAGLGDVGAHFPPGAPAWRNAPGALLLREVAALLGQAGWRIGNVDLTILAEAPAIAPHRSAMREALASALSIGTDQVSIKATTCEGLGAVGAQTAIAAHCVALIVPEGPWG